MKFVKLLKPIDYIILVGAGEGEWHGKEGDVFLKTPTCILNLYNNTLHFDGEPCLTEIPPNEFAEAVMAEEEQLGGKGEFVSLVENLIYLIAEL